VRDSLSNMVWQGVAGSRALLEMIVNSELIEEVFPCVLLKSLKGETTRMLRRDGQVSTCTVR